MKKCWGAQEELEEKGQGKNDITRMLVHKILNFFKLKKNAENCHELVTWLLLQSVLVYPAHPNPKV